VLIGAAIVFSLFPRKEEEQQLLAEYQAEDKTPPVILQAPQ
jgi:hypothetical protein